MAEGTSVVKGMYRAYLRRDGMISLWIEDEYACLQELTLAELNHMNLRFPSSPIIGEVVDLEAIDPLRPTP